MEHIKFYEALKSNRLITPIWLEVIKLIETEMISRPSNENYLIILLIYFSLTDDGNIALSLDPKTLLDKWLHKCEGNKILLEELDEFDSDSYDYLVNKSKEVISNNLINLNESSFPDLFGKHKYFEIEDNYFYIRKNNVARHIILERLDELFSPNFYSPKYDYKVVVVPSFRLKEGQEAAVIAGQNKNLVITGGPGTGKTTSILYLLIGLMISKHYEEIYLLAPSGKAASRMKDSIKEGLDKLNDEFRKSHLDLIDRIANLKRYTIHKLLGIDKTTNGFKHNKNNQLKPNSIFIIDEASMIDVCLFASLLSAIPNESRIYIMGDKDQLPSVDAGAVFGDLINKKSLLDNGNVYALGEAVRFKVGSPVYKLAQAINKSDVPLEPIEFKDEFLKVQESKEVNPVYYYSNPIRNSEIPEKEIVKNAVVNFASYYYKDNQKLATNLDPNDTSNLKSLFKKCVTNAVILSAENEGVRGVNKINQILKTLLINTKVETSIEGFYPGELIMVVKNNNTLDLSNGDSGILVTFKDDPNLYLMIEKDSEIIKTEQKITGKIFKLGGYIFYPFYLISQKDIVNSYAITIHKSQGSGYNNILVILPTKKGHPLLNRQIVYTAITRTKGDTYILSSYEMLLEAKNIILTRDTNIK